MSIYRMILWTPRPVDDPVSNPEGIPYPENGTYDTGANYPGCSPDDPAACDAAQFYSSAEAIQYAEARGEIPVAINSADEAWAIVRGELVPDVEGGASMFSNPLVLGLGALLLYRFMRRR